MHSIYVMWYNSSMKKQQTDFDKLAREHYDLEDPADKGNTIFEHKCLGCLNRFEVIVYETQFYIKIHCSTRSCPECGRFVTIYDSGLLR